MRILYLTPSPPNSMNRIRTQNIIKAMQTLGHSVTLVSFVYNDGDYGTIERCKAYIDDIRCIKQSKWKSVLNCALGGLLPVPLRVLYCKSRKMAVIVKECLEKEQYNLVYIKRLRMAQYARIAKNKGVPTIIDITDSLTKYYERIKVKEKGVKKIIAIEEYFKHRIYEPKVCRNYPPIVICSERDKDYLVNILPELENQIIVMHNSIETTVWQMKELAFSSVSQRTKLAFCGMMDYAPNIIATKYLITQVMPLLPSFYTLELIGANCTKELLVYENERIHFTGYVEDMQAALMKNDIFICPILAGSGVKNKILQASMAGLPIVSTTLGVEGIHKDIQNFIFIADQASAIADSIIQINILSEEELRRRVVGQQNVIINDNDNVIALKKCFDELGFEYG